MGGVAEGVGNLVKSVTDEVTGESGRREKRRERRLKQQAAEAEQQRLDEVAAQEEKAMKEAVGKATIRKRKKAAIMERGKTRGGTLLRQFGSASEGSGNKTLLGM
jgi:hypothetical protein